MLDPSKNCSKMICSRVIGSVHDLFCLKPAWWSLILRLTVLENKTVEDIRNRQEYNFCVNVAKAQVSFLSELDDEDFLFLLKKLILLPTLLEEPVKEFVLICFFSFYWYIVRDKCLPFKKNFQWFSWLLICWVYHSSLAGVFLQILCLKGPQVLVGWTVHRSA